MKELQSLIKNQQNLEKPIEIEKDINVISNISDFSKNINNQMENLNNEIDNLHAEIQKCNLIN